MEDGKDCKASIENLPSEVLECILSLVSPYEDLKSCMLVCKHWYRLARGAAKRRKSSFYRDLRNSNVTWFKHFAESEATAVAKRYAHSCCVYRHSMFVFGGCTATNTTFNDLWRFDLNRRHWVRPLAIGTYPPPKAFATFVAYKDTLILFGGLTKCSPSPLHQFHYYRLYNQLHFYEPQANQWTEIFTTCNPPPVAGHSATVHGNLMVVFGGRQLLNGQYRNSCNDVWVLDLGNCNWWKQETTEPKPPPMLHQMQIFVDDEHALIIGGWGGPNTILSDVWLLKVEHRKNVLWAWKKLIVKNPQNSATHLWCHSACKVDNNVVVLGRGPQTRSSMPTALNPMIKIPARIWVPPREDDESLFDVDNVQHQLNERNEEKRKLDVEKCVNGRRGVLPHINQKMKKAVETVCQSDPQSSKLKDPAPSVSMQEETCQAVASASCNDNMTMTSAYAQECGDKDSLCSYCGKTKKPSSKRMKMCCSGTSADASACAVASDASSGVENECCCVSVNLNKRDSSFCQLIGSRLPETSKPILGCVEVPPARFPLARNTAMPSVRPNAMLNRQRQLEGCHRMEERIRNLMRSAANSLADKPENGSFERPDVTKRLVTSARKPMHVYVLNLGRLFDEGEVEWLAVSSCLPQTGPEETVFYSLVHGRGELIMFGGIHKDENVMNQGSHYSHNMVSNHVYIMTSKHQTF